MHVWRQGYVALDTRWVPTGVKEILKSIQVAFVCVCVCVCVGGGGGGGGGLNPPAHVCLDFGNIILIWPTEFQKYCKIITYHIKFRSTVKIMVLNVRLK